MPPFDSAVFPNPFKPLVVGTPYAETSQQLSLQRQRVRRAEILATTRRVLAETGHERLTLKRISAECDIAIQTIRNSFGRREDLIVSAVNEHTTCIWQTLAKVSPGPAAFIDFSNMIYACALQAPDFLRGTLTIAFANNPSLLVLQGHAAATKTGLLKKMATQDLLRPGIDVDLLAAQITKLDTILMYEWSQNNNAEDLFRQMAAGHKVLLLGALRESAAMRIENQH